MEGLLRMEDGDQILLFARCFYGSPSTYLWEDELGNTQEIPQGEGGEQGDPLMPMLFSLAEHPALEAIQRRLIDGEKLLAYLDDVRESWEQCSRSLVKSSPDMHRSAYTMGRRRWNRGGATQPGVEEFGRLARLVKPEAVVWRGDTQLPAAQQGVVILGVPIGSPDFVRQQLEEGQVCRARSLVPTHSLARGHPSMLAPVVDVCFNQGEFLAPRCLPRTNRVIRCPS